MSVTEFQYRFFNFVHEKLIFFVQWKTFILLS